MRVSWLFVMTLLVGPLGMALGGCAPKHLAAPVTRSLKIELGDGATERSIALEIRGGAKIAFQTAPLRNARASIVRHEKLDPSFQDVAGFVAEWISVAHVEVGFLRASTDVASISMDPAEKKARATIVVTDGIRYRFGLILVREDVPPNEPVLPPDIVERRLACRKGDWFSRTKASTDVQSLTTLYRNHGHFLVDVYPLTDMDEERQNVMIIFDVQVGPLFFIDHFEVAGEPNPSAVEEILDMAPLHAGDLFRANALREFRKRIAELGRYKDVAIEPTRVPETNRVVITVRVDRP